MPAAIIHCVFLSAVDFFQVGGSLLPVTMAGTTYHQEGRVPPWCRWFFIGSIVLFPADLIEQTTLSAFFPITLLCFQKSGAPQIMERPADGGLRQLQFSGDGRDGWPALAVLIRPICKVEIHGNRPVRQFHPVEEIKTAHWLSPPAAAPVSLLPGLSAAPACGLAGQDSCRFRRFSFPQASSAVSAVAHGSRFPSGPDRQKPNPPQAVLSATV